MTADGSPQDLDQVLEQYHGALGVFMKGDHEPAKRLFSERDDVTLGNPFGPFARGWTQVVEAMGGRRMEDRPSSCRSDHHAAGSRVRAAGRLASPRG